MLCHILKKSLITNMDNNELHNEQLNREFFSNTKTSYNKSKEEVWNEISSQIDKPKKNNTKTKKTKSIQLRFFYGLAAGLLLLLGTTLMLRYYSNSSYCPEGEQLTVKLPGGSVATLQSGSTLTYYPLWWKYSRRLILTGEAYFDVKKGNEFKVTSSFGSTFVMGTTFNILAQNNKYKVTCYSGLVKVLSISERSVILNPDYSAEIASNGEIVVSKHFEEYNQSVNRNNMFNYSSVPLSKVIEEIEDYYNIIVSSSSNLEYNYTGFFSKQKTAEEALYLICKPYGLTFVVLSENKYHIIKN